ncbi:MAG: Trk system potassium transport protein TrkA [Clostridiales bacterium GWC2_40_7]|nr:MAG: Trk system potassium transport protein TrkA [Clostridiales bacterium GWC2_40_7]
MKIIIIGDGKVGYSLAENLSKENSDVTIIDKNAEALKKAGEFLDVMCIKGNGVSTKILLEAGVKEADLLIAATTSDEMNMVCCLTAKKLGAKHTIARIRDPEYANELSMLKADLGLDMVINPEQAAANEIARLLSFPSAVNVEEFAKGRVELVELKVTAEMSIIGMQLKHISSKISSSILIGAVLRRDEVIIPNGVFEIRENDTLYIIGRSSSVFNFCKQISKGSQKVKNVMIVGGGRIAYYLAKYLDETGMKVKIIEIDREKCIALSELLPNALIINGDGSDDTVLQSENLSDMGAFVSLTGRDEENLMSALLAKQWGVQKVVAKINRINYAGVIKNMGIDSVVSPKMITANHIVRYVRGLKNALGNPVETLYKIIGDQAEAIEFTAGASTRFLDIPLKNLKVVQGVIVAAIVRKNEIIIPHGKDVIKPGDSVILIAKDKKFSDLNDIIAPGGIPDEL